MLSNGTTSQAKHKRTPSAVLKSIVASRSNPRSEEGPPTPAKDQPTTKLSPAPLGEIHYNLERTGPSSSSSSKERMERGRLLNSKSKVDLKAKSQEQEKSRLDTKATSPKKAKSSTNLAALLGKGKSKQNKVDQVEVKNKENEPPKSAGLSSPPPIWAQFSSNQPAQSTKVALNDIEGKHSRPNGNKSTDASPSKTCTTTDHSTLAKPHGIKIPLKAAAEDKPEQSSRSFGLLHRSNSSKSMKERANEIASRGRDAKPASRPPTSDGGKITGTMRGQSRVRAAVAAISGKNKDTTVVSKALKTNPIDIEKEFEDMLEARNIAPEVREKMRALDKSIKADLIKQNNGGPAQADNGSAGSRTSSRPGMRSRTNTTESVHQPQVENESTEKKARPRSFTGFTLSKGASSPKKQKQSKPSSHSRGKSADIPRSTSTTSLVSVASTSSFSLFGKSPKVAMPDDFISYLRSNTKPQSVEVGKIQKLRQLLRNETVTWVDEFISEGGMIELVNLVYRIIDIQWREEHEDNLLHHTLTCLKALTTTSAAMQQLEGLQAKLFPTLLALLFSSGEEKKGPSEFNTRGLITSLLFASITACPTPAQARVLLSYLKDPTPKEAPVGFIAEMHRPRPYKLWFNEISNVTKEVFWIFLHGVNVIDYAGQSTADLPYYVAHFPTPRPPVPAAPYVGSVEWDATIYLATHMDLLNGIIASLETAEERNRVRTELRDSGFEKLMGGTLRICKEKFYGHVHAGLSTWAGAARADGWDSKDVREGPPREPSKRARSASPKKGDQAPILAMPKLEFQDAKPLSPVLANKSQFDLGGDWL